ncbi:MAG: hypothetical protein KIT61_07755, partial [Pyrinomonadaceae bacterium]|nr:hypothetical protein [Pyrinomonadaceae bacterium]
GNGRWENMEFNSRLQPTKIGLGSGVASQSLLKLEYSYGTTANNGNVLGQTITIERAGQSDLVFDQTYSYDSLNRITSAEEKTGTTTNWLQTYTFDRYGNRNFVEANTTTLPKNCGTSPNYTVCSADVPIVNPSVNTSNNRLSGTTYDAAGNVIVDAEGRQFIYDAENKQIEVENPQDETIGQYFFDGDGKRVKKVVPNGETTIFVYDASGKLVAEYSTVVASSQDAKIQYLTNDHLGTPRINTNSTGQVISRSDYMPYGEEITGLGGRSSADKYIADDVRQGFTGYENDDETGLHFAQARNFSPTLGRFLTTDPSRKSASISTPQTWNRYAYCLNNPQVLVDRNGKWPTEIHNNLIRGSFRGLKPNDIAHIQSGSWIADCCSGGKPASTLWPSEAYKHAMTPYGMSPEDAIRKTGAYLDGLASKARREQLSFERMGGQGLSPKALVIFGQITHVYEDMTSPAHGFDKTYAIPQKPTSQSGYLTAKAGENPLNTTQPDMDKWQQELDDHAAIEQRDPTPGERARTELNSRAAFVIVFGQKAFSQLDLTDKERDDALNLAKALNPKGLPK